MKREDEIAKMLLASNAVTLRPQNPFKYASGILSPIYCDNRLIISLPEERKRIINAFLKRIEESKLEFDVIAGTATAGIPHAAWISDRLAKPMIYVRQEAKDHGKQNAIEGSLRKGERVIVIEDLISTGGSSAKAVKGVRSAGGIVEACFAIFTYEMKKAKASFQDLRCKVYPLTTLSALVRTAVSEGYISKEEEKTVLEWNLDPETWGRKMGFE